MLKRIKNKFLKFRDNRYRNPPMFLHPRGEYLSDQIRKTGAYYELEVLHFLRKNSDFSKVIDVGANIGNHSKFFSEFGGEVFSIEPILKNYKLLKKNVPLAKTFNLAIGNEFKEVEFVTYESCFGNSYMIDAHEGLIYEQGGKGIKKELVKAVTLDSLDLPSPTLIKIDVEGSELRTLYGAEKLLTSSKSIKLCIEILQTKSLEITNTEFSQKQIINLLNNYGFNKCQSINKTNFLFSKI